LRVRLNQPTIRCVTADEQAAEFVSDLLTEIPRTAVVPAVRAALGVPEKVAKQIVQAFGDYVARPLDANLKNLHGRDLAKRNPMIYTTRGIDSAEEWVERVLADKETSAFEGHIGGAQQPRGGRPALPQPQDRRSAPQPHLRKARCAFPHQHGETHQLRRCRRIIVPRLYQDEACRATLVPIAG
jgi:hypothetical protein